MPVCCPILCLRPLSTFPAANHASCAKARCGLTRYSLCCNIKSMSAFVIDGKSIADAVVTNVREQVQVLSVPLHLAAVCTGDDPALRSFVKLKQKAAQAAGVTFSSYFFDEPDEAEIISTLDYLAQDELSHGIFVELPVPAELNREKNLSHMPLSKDADVISPKGEMNFYADKDLVLPPAVKALEYVLDEYGVNLTKTITAVVGQGQLVGRPITHWLQRQGAKVLSIDVATSNPEKITTQADLIIIGIGSPRLVSGDWIKDGAVVIDYGYNRDTDGAIAGDVDFTSVSKKAALIT